MSRSEQTLETIRTDFDRIALFAEENWNHNAHYHEFLISYIPAHCQKVLEIGCGTGKFSRLLASRAERIIAVDLSPQMIRLAAERSKLYQNIDFVCGDVTNCELPDNQFDCIATVSTLHHLAIETALRKISRALKPGGLFICLDLYQSSGPMDLLFGCVAYPLNILFGLIKNGRPLQPLQVRKAYAEHGKTDTYPTMAQIKQVCADILPEAKVRRHLFWRYSIIWKKGLAD
jgi:ubiquinone/menaquinone biosynthesis C-methylase UbiE